MTVIATNTVRPTQGKAKLQPNNMLELTKKAFGDMGITARVSRFIFRQNARCLFFSTFMSNIAMPLSLARVAVGEMKPTHRVINYRCYLIKKNKNPLGKEKKKLN